MKLYSVPFCMFCLILSSCRQPTNKQLAQDYYKLAMLEIAGKAHDSQSLKKSLIFLDKALAQDQRSEYQGLKATVLFMLGDYVQSSALFTQALSLEKDRLVKSELLNNYACVCAQMGRSDEALRIWKELEKDTYYLTPEVALVNQGKVYGERDEYAAASNVFSRAVQLAPQYLDAHYYLALTAYHSGNLDLAKNEIATVLFLEPDHQGARQLAGTLGIGVIPT